MGGWLRGKFKEGQVLQYHMDLPVNAEGFSSVVEALDQHQ